jgi:segregation and condensation protein B
MPGPAETAEEELEEPEECVGVSPQSVVEAMLFVGKTDNQPLTSRQIAALLRGVSAIEVDEMVAALNREYRDEERPFWIESVDTGYVLRLHPEYAGLRDRFYGRVREARLSQAAIDVLAIVAYQQPLNQEQIDRLRGKPSGGVLRQLVRRQLLSIERSTQAPRHPNYRTTDRFLQLFGLESLAELPESQEDA